MISKFHVAQNVLFSLGTNSQISIQFFRNIRNPFEDFFFEIYFNFQFLSFGRNCFNLKTGIHLWCDTFANQ